MGSNAVAIPEGWESETPTPKAAVSIPEGWESETQATLEEPSPPKLTFPEKAIGGMGMLAAGLAKSPADVGVSMLRQAVAYPVSGLAGIAGAVLPGPEGQGAEYVQKAQETIGGQPFTAAGRAAVTGLGAAMEPAIEAARAPGSYLAEKGVPALGIEPSEATRVGGAILSGVPEAALSATGMRAPIEGVAGAGRAAAGAYRAAESRLARPSAPVSFGEGTPTPRGAINPEMTPEARASRLSMGAAETPELAMVQASVDLAPQIVRDTLKNVPLEEVNVTALDRHAKAQSLPVPVPLTRGMATADSVMFTEERNLRGRLPEIAQRLDQYPVIFQENLQAFREQMAPDVFGEPTSQMLGAEFTNRYKTLDKTLKTAISSAYDDVKNAMGGREMLVDTATLEPTVMRVLQNERAARWLPENLRAELADLSSSGSVPFDQIDKLRSVIGRDIRGYNRAGKGNEAFAAGVLLRQLEEMPFVGEVGDVAVLADRARGLARNRFELLRADQAFDAVVNAKIRPDKFVQKFVTGAGEQGVARLLQTLDGTDANQLAKLALLKQLDDKTGTMAFAIGERAGSRNMTAAGFDRTLRSLSDSGVLSSVFTPEELAQVINLGDVMRYTQQTGAGGYVNYSGTATAQASGVFQQQVGAAGAQMAEAGLQAAGVPAGAVKFGKGVISTMANRKFIKDSLEPIAGIRKAKK